MKVEDPIAVLHQHPAHQARVQYEAMAQCGHPAIGTAALERCERCLGPSPLIHAQHTFIDVVTAEHEPGYGHLRALQEA